MTVPMLDSEFDPRTDEQPAPIEYTPAKTRKRKSAAQILADLDAQQAAIDEARAAARKSLERRSTHLKILLGGLIFAVADADAEAQTKDPWILAHQLIDIAAAKKIKTERVKSELANWIRDQNEIAAAKAAIAEAQAAKAAAAKAAKKKS